MLQDLPVVGRRERHPEQIYSTILDWLVESGAQPGDRLPSETDMAKHFGVSRTTMREAIRILEHSGLVVVKRGRTGGMFVGKGAIPQVVSAIRTLLLFDQTSLESMAEARQVIEVEVTRLAAQRVTPEHMETLAGSIEAMRQDTSAEGVISANTRFHLTIADACGNPILQSMMTAIMNLLNEIAEHTSDDYETVDLKLEGHRIIYDALERRDPTAAAEAMREHVRTMHIHGSRRRRQQREANGQSSQFEEHTIPAAVQSSFDDD